MGLLENAGLITTEERQQRKKANLEYIIAKAELGIKDNDSDKRPTDDWLMDFYDKAENVCDEGMQDNWSRILAAEVNAPCSIPKTLLHILSFVNNAQLLAFKEMCGYVTNCGIDVKPAVFMTTSFGSKFVKPEIALELDALGLLSFSTSGFFLSSRSHSNSSGEFLVSYFDRELCVAFDKPFTIRTGDIVLTQSGTALYRCLGRESGDYNDEYFINLIGYFQSNNLTVKFII